VHKLNPKDKLLLKELFNFIIPPSLNNVMPGAGFLFDNNYCFKLSDVIFFNNVVIKLYSEYINPNNEGISRCDSSDLVPVIQKYQKNHRRDFNDLVFKVINYYYTDQHILHLIGIKESPPFPEGNLVDESDMLIFEPVYLLGKIYRD